MRISVLLAFVFMWGAQAQDGDVAKKLDGFDDYMAKVLKDWNGPGIGVGIVVGDKLVFAKGYGYRDYETSSRSRLERCVPSRQTPNCSRRFRPACWWKKAN